MSKSLQLNGGNWKCSELGESALLLEPEISVPVEIIHQATGILEQANLTGVIDLIPAYKSIALLYDDILTEITEEIEKIQLAVSNIKEINISPKTHTVPVCYHLGLDWQEVEKFTSQEKEDIIRKHLNAEYKVAMMGFIPGFVYLEGLDESIACPRKENPRMQIPAGSVGIGGNQAGIYSLESPGGWQIIGRTPLSFFNSQTNPPTNINPGDRLVFEQISEAEFHKMKEASS
ncbi:MAG: 5-oxoprolinase subunit PxpB [Balneolaceae bacterium]